jgi:hypothetical protein
MSSKDKMVRPEAGEKRGLVTDVVVPIAQSGLGGAVGGAVSAAVGGKLGGEKPPPPKKD